MTSPARGGRRWRAVLATATAGALVGAAVVAAPLPAQAAKKGGTLKVMTQNLYLGADLFPAVAAAQNPDPTAFLLAAAEVYKQAVASDFPLRAAEIAKTVKAQDPDIIGLQEVTNWVPLRTNAGPALTSVDFLAVLTKALKAEGLNYKVVVANDNASIGPIPYLDPSVGCVKVGLLEGDCFVTLKDRDAILVNADTSGLTYKKSSVVSGLYKRQATFTVAGTTQSFARGYGWVDMTYNGAKFRFANTHLEVEGTTEAIQVAQGKQFVKLVKKGAGTVIATGDFNTDAYGTTSPTYANLTKSYFSDAWSKKRDGTGLSCCQNSTLSNATSENRTRIDLVLLHGSVKAKKAVNVNVTPFRTDPPPLWESDHAGVVATIQVK